MCLVFSDVLGVTQETGDTDTREPCQESDRYESLNTVSWWMTKTTAVQEEEGWHERRIPSSSWQLLWSLDTHPHETSHVFTLFCVVLINYPFDRKYQRVSRVCPTFSSSWFSHPRMTVNFCVHFNMTLTWKMFHPILPLVSLWGSCFLLPLLLPFCVLDTNSGSKSNGNDDDGIISLNCLLWGSHDFMQTSLRLMQR